MSIPIEKLYFANVDKWSKVRSSNNTGENEMPRTHIYTLSDPRTDEVRYVGKTRDPKGRIRNHIGKREHNHKGNWIESLRKLNLTPIVHFIDNVPTTEWSFWEQHWIQTFLGWGFKLTNMNAGGGLYARFTPELKAKHKASFTEAVCEDMRDKAKINMNKPEVKMKHSEAVKLAMNNPETKTKMQKTNDIKGNSARSEKVKAFWANPENKLKRSAAMRKANASADVKAKRVASGKKRAEKGGLANFLAAAHKAARKQVTLEKGDQLKTFEKLEDAAEFLGVARSSVGRCASGKFKSNMIKGWLVRRAGIEPATVSLEG